MAERCKCGAALPPPKKKIVKCAKCGAIYIYTPTLFGDYEYQRISK